MLVKGPARGCWVGLRKRIGLWTKDAFLKLLRTVPSNTPTVQSRSFPKIFILCLFATNQMTRVGGWIVSTSLFFSFNQMLCHHTNSWPNITIRVPRETIRMHFLQWPSACVWTLLITERSDKTSWRNNKPVKYFKLSYNVPSLLLGLPRRLRYSPLWRWVRPVIPVCGHIGQLWSNFPNHNNKSFIKFLKCHSFHVHAHIYTS